VKALEQRWLEVSLDPVLFVSAAHVSLSIICLYVLTCGIRATFMLFCSALNFLLNPIIYFVNIIIVHIQLKNMNFDMGIFSIVSILFILITCFAVNFDMGCFLSPTV